MNKLASLAFVSGVVLLAGASAGGTDSFFMNGSPESERTLRSFNGKFDVQEFYN